MKPILTRVCLVLLSLLSACSFRSCDDPVTTSKPMKNPAPDAIVKPGVAMTATHQRRVVYVLLDLSASYLDRHDPALLERIVRQTLSIVKSLGPADEFLFAFISDRFDPRNNVKRQESMPPVAAELLQPTSQPQEWIQRQKGLKFVWRQVVEKQQAMEQWFNQPITERSSVTDLYGALEYCAERLSREHDCEKHLVVFTDFEHDFKGVKSSDPPKLQLDFREARVSALFAPWEDHAIWKARRQAWDAWFRKQGASDFSMYDVRDSERQVVLKSSAVPKTLPSPFGQAVQK